MDVSRKLSRTITQYTNELLMISLKALALATLLSIIDVGSDFIQGINLSMDPELVLYGIITIAINWLPGAIAMVHLVTYQRYELGPLRTIFCSVFLVTFYPIVPTLTFLAVYWVKGNLNDENKRNGSKELDDEKVENTADSRNYKILSHWAKMAPLIEGAIEAPIQFLFQFFLIMTGKLPTPFEIGYISWTDPNGNTISIPQITAITIALSFMSMLKTCIGLNLQGIHFEQGSNLVTILDRVFVYIPFFIASAFFRLSAISLLLTYITYWTLIPVTVTFIANLYYGIASTIEKQKEVQYYFWRFQCIVSCIVFIPSLMAVAILVNYYQGFRYETTGAILANHEFNTYICVSIIMGFISLLMSIKPDFIDLIENRIENTMFDQGKEAELEDVQIKATENDLDIFMSAEENTQSMPTKQNSRKQSFIKVLKNKKLWCFGAIRLLVCFSIFFPFMIGFIVQQNVAPSHVFMKSDGNDGLKIKGSLIFGKMAKTYGCLENYPPRNKQSRDTIGYIMRNDIEDLRNLTLPENYLALVFITDKYSSPDEWFISKVQDSIDDTKPLIKVNQMHINLTKASEMLIGGKSDIDMIELSNSSECQTINPRYLPQSVECGQDNFFCWAESHKKVVICYWRTWNPNFHGEDIDPTLCSHLIYSQAWINTTDDTMYQPDWIKNNIDFKEKGFRCFVRYKYPHLKVMFSIEVPQDNSKKVYEMATNSSRRQHFIQSVLDFCIEYDFDGIDLVWHFPTPTEENPDIFDKAVFTTFLKHLSESLSRAKLTLTLTIPKETKTIEASYDIPEVYKYVDYLNILSYDYHSYRDGKTGENAPLYPRPDEIGIDATYNVNYTLQYLLSKGALAEKTVLGIPFFGQSYVLVDEENNTIGANSSDHPCSGTQTDNGQLFYQEICKELLNTKEKDWWNVVWDDSQKAPYMYRGSIWISYDDQTSVAVKTEFAFENRLAGVMTFAIDLDDYRGMCEADRYPLLRKINHVLYQQVKNKYIEQNGGTYVTKTNVWRLDGRCGCNFPLPDGSGPATCDFESNDPCCSEYGYCGNTDEHCNSPGIDYRKVWQNPPNCTSKEIDTLMYENSTRIFEENESCWA